MLSSYTRTKYTAGVNTLKSGSGRPRSHGRYGVICVGNYSMVGGEVIQVYKQFEYARTHHLHRGIGEEVGQRIFPLRLQTSR